MPAARTQYAWANGHGVALAALKQVETDLWPYTHPVLLAPKARPLNLYPVRSALASGGERGDGFIRYAWGFDAMPIAAFDYILDTYYNGGTGVQHSLTLNVRRHERLSYARCNAYAFLPNEGDDYTYDRRLVRDLRLRFTVLTLL